ncbi:MAG: fructosamine kinase family protein [Flavobacteriaceae bacterium]|nr:fructosamine kinase family protein [Flavobacteriaceae bacterium]
MFFKQQLQDHLKEKITGISALSGGDINETYKISTDQNTYALKVNRKDAFPQMFEKEKLGLDRISATGARVPKAILTYTSSTDQFLLLEYIEEVTVQPEFWENFASDLAKIHRTSDALFGLPYNNYIGSLKQINTQTNSWESFFVNHRILPLMQKAFDAHLLNKNHLKGFENLFGRLNELLPVEKPSLIHGDLWAGNLMKGADQTPVFIDPAIYFGNREMDLAMTQMFGGFDQVFFKYYDAIFPLEIGWQQRIKIHNLYPNLVHLVLFGKSYLGGIESVIKHF